MATRPSKPHRRRNGSGKHTERPRAPNARAPSDRAPGGGGEWLYGRHAVRAALANPRRRVKRLLATNEGLAALGLELRAGAPEPEVMAAADIAGHLPAGAAHQGLALAADPLAPMELDEAIASSKGDDHALVLVLDQVTDPGNVGAILRSAAAFGAMAVVLPARRGAGSTPALAKAASGALETVPMVRVTNVSRALATLKGAGFWCVGLDAHAGQALAEADLSGRIALVLGSEDRGLRRLVAEQCDFRARLPIAKVMESLNVAAAAAVALYEVRRGAP